MNKPQVFLLAIITGIFFIAIGCNSNVKQNSTQTVDTIKPVDSVSNGQALFQSYCKGCHLLPDPTRLPKDIWEHGVLPIMALRMGLKNTDYMRVISPEEDKIEKDNHLIPEVPMVSDADFEAIKTYILSVAPQEVFYAEERIGRSKEITQFVRKEFSLQSEGPSLISALKFDAKKKVLWVGDLYNKVVQWKWGKGVVATEGVSSAVVDFNFDNGKTYFTEIGSLPPSELSQGALTQSGQTSSPIIEKLHRPVFSIVEDLNKDGIAEILVGNFGKNLGSLSLYKKQKKGGSYQETVLLAVPGVVKCFVKDMNNDGLKDVIALFSQADESVYVFYQQKNFSFKAERVLRFPPDYGTTDMVLQDYNKDGLVDIITANGDNADYSRVLKNYHGIRININQGDNVFKETFFYPAYGATKVIAEDFDQDGDLDFAISCFYSDFGALLNESFIYLQNQDAKTYQFSAFTQNRELPVKSLTLEKADIDGDGDIDIILGNCAFSPVPVPENLGQQWKSAGYGLIVFENKLK